MTLTRSVDSIMETYVRWPVEFVSGSGANLFDTTGRSYIDLTAGLAVANVGHAHPRVAAAVAEQASQLMHVSNLYSTGPQQRLADRLYDLSSGMSSFFCNSGAESIECALKLARRVAKDAGSEEFPAVVAAEGSFHGRTFGALAATGQPAKREVFEPMLPGFRHVPFGDIDALEASMDHDVAAVLLEPIQGEGGVIVPPPEYLAGARDLCDRYSALLVLDEVQTGMGRTGAWFAFEHFDVRPDVVCLAKGLAGGLPIGVCLASPDAAAFRPGDHASTFGGGPVQCSAALATIDVIQDEDLLGGATTRGAYLRAGLEQVFGAGNVRGIGLMLAAELPAETARAFCGRALERGVLVNDVTPSTLRFIPPLVISEAAIDEALLVLQEVVDEDQTP